MNAHTPGPWFPGKRHPGVILSKWDKPNDRVYSVFVANACHSMEDAETPTEQESANARLIAQAPAMLEALREVAGLYLSDTPSPHDPSRGLASKARAILRAIEEG